MQKHLKMKKKISFFILLLASLAGQAQVKTFTTDINDSLQHSFQAISMRQTYDGGYVETGYISMSQSLSNIFLVKLSPSGKKEWFRILSDSAINYIYSVRQTPDRGYVIAGGPYFNGNFKVLLDKFDSAGNLLWSKNYGGAYNESAFDLQLTKDGGFIMAGYFQTINSVFSTFNHGYVIKTDSKGDTLWTVTFGDSLHQAVANCVAQTSDGGYIIGGFKVIDTFYDYNYILKIDSAGKKIWEKTYGDATGTYDYLVNSIIQSKDGNYYATGAKALDATFGYGGISNLYVFKLNPNGDSLWQKYYANDSSSGRDIIQAADGELVVTGGNNIGMNNNVYIAKISSSGILRWEKNLPTVPNGYGTSIMQTTDRGYAICGTQVVNQIYTGALAIKTDTSGNVYGAVDTLNIMNSTTTGVEAKISPEQAIILYPNPFTYFTTIYIKNGNLQKASLSIYSVDGKEINRIDNINGNQIIIDRKNLSAGMYFYRLINSGQVISAGKLIAE